VNSIFNPDDSMCDMNKVTVDGTVGVGIVNGVMKYKNGTGYLPKTRRGAFLEIPDENMDKLKPQYDDVDKPNDMVNHPSHYASGKIECIDAIEVATDGLDGIEAVCTGNAIKYMWRWKNKSGKQDIQKAIWYLKRLLKSME